MTKTATLSKLPMPPAGPATGPVKLYKAVMPEGIDPLAAMVLHALPKVSDEARDGLGVGDHGVDMEVTLRVRGVLSVGADTSTAQVNRLHPWELAKLLADKVPPAVLDQCIDAAIAAAKATSKDDPAVLFMAAEADDLKARVEAAFEHAGCTVRQVRRGAVSLKGTLEVEVRE